MMGIEPTNGGTTILCLNHLATPAMGVSCPGTAMARPAGFEPAASRLEGGCSIP